MAEVARRDSKANKLNRLYAAIEEHANVAAPERITIWQRELDTVWNEYERLHQLVLDRAGVSEIDEQEAFYEDVHDTFDAASVILEGARNARAAPAALLDGSIQLQRRYEAVTQRLLIACERINNNIGTMQIVEIGIERANIEQLYQSLQTIAIDRVTQGENQILFLEDEETSAAMYRNTMHTLITAQAPHVVQPLRAAAEADALKIPHLHITPFDGQFDKWESFRESFTHGIHNRQNMPAVQKLQYLKSVLRAEPEELVRNFGLTAENYESAWRLMNERYNNRRELVSSHLRILTSLPACEETADDLRRISNKTASSLLALKNLGRPIDEWNDWIVFHVCEKLDTETRRMWEQQQPLGDAFPTWLNLDLFLQGRIRALSCVGNVPSKPLNRFPVSKYSKTRAHQVSTVKSQQETKSQSPVQQYCCPICDKSHLITFCEEFRRLTISERRRIVAEKKLCFICLSTGHMANDCKSNRLCQKCGQRHNTMLHLSEITNNEQQVRTHTAGCKSQVLLATAIVNVRDREGEFHPMRALLDQGSEASFVSENAAQLLQLPRQQERSEIIGLGGVSAGRTKQSLEMEVNDRHGFGFTMKVQAMVIPRITGTLAKMSVCDGNRWSHITNLVLADPEYMEPHSVDLLLGSDVYGTLLRPGIRQRDGLPTAQNTAFGWILSGNVLMQNKEEGITHKVLSNHATIDDQLAKFWEIEETSSIRRLTAEEERCETFYEKTVSRDFHGRIHVRIPMKHDDVIFGESQRFAVQRQLQIERRFETNPDFAKEYRKFMAQYYELGHVREVVGAPVDLTRNRAMLSTTRREYYIPHHAVINEASSTTKLRVVFDASRRTTNGVALNEQMLIGPRLQDNLTAIMMRWRKFQFAFCADVEKMYRQIIVDEPDTDMQRIVWRPTTNEEMKVYQLSTVTYGTASAPYLAIKSLQTLANFESENYPIGAQIALNDFYVDDVLSGTDTISDCIEAQKQLMALMISGGMMLRKWASNCEAVLAQVDPENRECELPLNIEDGKNISTLGVQWNPAVDEISFKIEKADEVEKYTKRTFLSAAARLYDPLGWLAPCTIVVKIMFQSLWKLHLEWDDDLPTEILLKWNKIRTGIQELKKLRIPRWIGASAECQIELHGFCDASLDAYAAVVYVRVQNANRPVKIVNLCAKTKVAPIKVMSLPRLELCGAILLVKLIDDVKKAMQWPAINVRCWTDSTIVLAWLRGHPSSFNVFVANRTAEIQRRFPIDHWQHVMSEDNPADCASRGITAQQLINHRLWWTGPQWLRNESSRWPYQPKVQETTEEMRTRVNIAKVGAENWDLINKYSSLNRLIRVTAYCARFTRNCRIPLSGRLSGPLKTKELLFAREFWILHVQKIAFSDELQSLRNKKTICKTSSLRAINPFLSSDNLLRVGGRLANALGMTTNARTPAIIPRQSKLSALLISDAHHQTMHGGPSLMLSYLRRAYWIIDGPNEVRRYVKKCIVCCRYAAKPEQQIMAALPAARVLPSRPFLRSALDYSGAIMVRSAKGRGHHATKGYVAIFVCMATKAVHIELVGDLKSTGFLAAYERFAARRGCCSDLYSDNATNFVGAAKFLQSERKVFTNKVQTTLANKGTTWHFAPPLSPHFNGLAEAAIRSVKYHICRVIGESTLTFEEFTTVLAKIEACMNSRPLCPMTSNIDDLDVLTPGHFLIGEPITTIPQKVMEQSKASALTRWQLTHQIVQRVWKRWSTDYLHTLQQRRKWQQPNSNICLGDMVLMVEDNMPPAKWALGRVIEVHPGKDDKVRVVTIRTKDSTYKRSIVKIVKLPVDAD